MPTAAILLSRQPKHPHGGLKWVAQTAAAVRHAGAAGHTILTSVGMSTWEIILTVAKSERIPVKIILKDFPADMPAARASVRHDFDLGNDVEIVPPACLNTPSSDSRYERDRQIVTEADLLLPVSIRPNGRMAALLTEAEAQGKRVDRSFLISYEPRVEPLAYVVPTQALNECAATVSRDYLTHWTRGATGHWPDERALDYYRAVIDATEYPRTAFHTLRHILTERRLVASRRHMPRNTATVAFTALSIADVLPLMRWRAKYAEMAFEPYGLGIRRDLAAILGIYPVQYYDPDVAYHPCTVEPWLTQSVGQKTDWRQEHEYRHKGDLNLEAVPKDALIAFCPTQKEAAALEDAAGIRTLSLFSHPT